MFINTCMYFCVSYSFYLCEIHLVWYLVLTICVSVLQSMTVDNISYSLNHDKHQVNNQLPAHKFIVVLYRSWTPLTETFMDLTVWRTEGAWFSEPPLKAASVSWILGVCSSSQYNPADTQRENTAGNISTCVKLWLSPVTLLRNFSLFLHWTEPRMGNYPR